MVKKNFIVSNFINNIPSKATSFLLDDICTP